MNEIKENNRTVSLKDVGGSNKMYNEATTKYMIDIQRFVVF